MGKPRAEKYEGENGRKREEELEIKIGTTTDFLFTDTVCYQGRAGISLETDIQCKL